MVKHTIQIFGRIKPTDKTLAVYSFDNHEKTGASLQFVVPRDLADGFVNNKRESYRFRFQRVFDQHAKQEDIFEHIAKPVVESVLAGYNGTIFAYGQTGSGKTFTISGGAERYCDRGIIPRSLSYLYQRFGQDSNIVYTTHISYLEIYNEVGYDLLDSRHEASRLEDLPKVMIMEDPEQNIHLRNLSMQQSANEEEALNLLFLGDTNRMIAETPMNQASTRSHCIFTVHLCRREPGSATLRRSKLHLVDLSGSDRVGKTGLDGQLLTEAKYINLSLHFLEQVIIALSEKNRSHIPYRNSMLTSVLRDSLGGNCTTTMIATLAIDKGNIDESISTCRFAQRVALIKNEAVLNEEVDPSLVIAQLKQEIVSLKEELVMVSGEQRDDQLTAEEILALEELVRAFVENPDPDGTLSLGPDMRKIRRSFSLLKSMVLDKQGGKNGSNERQKSPERRDDVSAAEVVKLKELLKQRDSEISILVRILKKEKKRADDATAQLAVFSENQTLSSQKGLSSDPQPRVANMTTFPEERQGQGLPLIDKVETATAEHGGRLFTVPQLRDRNQPDLQSVEGNKSTLTDNRTASAIPPLREGNMDTFPINQREQMFARLHFGQEHALVDHRARGPSTPQPADRNVENFPANHEGLRIARPQLKERNPESLQKNQGGQESTIGQVKEESMEILPVVHEERVSIASLPKEDSTVPLEQDGRAVQRIKTGSQLSMVKQEAFEIFIRDHEERSTIEDNKTIFKERSAEAKKLVEELSEARTRINELKKQLDTRRRQKAASDATGNPSQAEEFDPMEEKLCAQIREEKSAYKSSIGRLKALRTETEHLQLLLERVKVKIQKDFQKWWSQETCNLQDCDSGAGRRRNTASLNGSLQPSSPGSPGLCAPGLASTPRESTTDSSAPELRSSVPDNVPAAVNKSLDGTMSPDSSQWRDLAATSISSSSIPLTGDQQVDADILAFVMARKNLLSRIGCTPPNCPLTAGNRHQSPSPRDPAWTKRVLKMDGSTPPAAQVESCVAPLTPTEVRNV
ncbi:kinesin-like protein KIF6 isoform X1 [Nothobranchius furzeri]|uniref:kinesin-like protein KIF6 isoform X1 n=1 Tax=Nothobranchius furzeri TaxID=105023 RepID=UPI003904831A